MYVIGINYKIMMILYKTFFFSNLYIKINQVIK